MNTKTFEIKPYTTKELYTAYGITRQVWRKWLFPIKEKIGPVICRIYTPSQVKIIIDHLGEP